MSTLRTLKPADLWRRYPRESAGLAMAALLGVAMIAESTGSTLRPPVISTADQAAFPLPPAMENRPVAPLDAVKINSDIPLAGPAGVARPFLLAGANAAVQARALECLTSAVYYEAGQEPIDGQRAVAQVILNRVRHPAFPSSVCGVVYQGSTRQTGCQFTFTCDGSMARSPMQSSWDRARKVATAALAGAVYPNVGTATHYHADYVVPYWASSLAKTAVVGAHLFYRWSGGWGLPKAFGQSYSGRESDPRMLRTAAMSIVDLPAVVLPIVTPVTEPIVTQLDGAMVLTETDTKRVKAFFSPKANRTGEKDELKSKFVRVAGSTNLPWSLLGNASTKTEKPTGAATPDTSTKTN